MGKEISHRSAYVFEAGEHARPRAPSRSGSEAGKDFSFIIPSCVSSEKYRSGNFYTTGDFQTDKYQITSRISLFFFVVTTKLYRLFPIKMTFARTFENPLCNIRTTVQMKELRQLSFLEDLLGGSDRRVFVKPFDVLNFLF